MKGKMVYIVGENRREPKGDSDKTFIWRERGDERCCFQVKMQRCGEVEVAFI